MIFPIGPDEVGLEPVVLPVSASSKDGQTCLVVAPTCRYGQALYRPVAVWPSGELVADEEDLAESGNWCMCALPIGEPVLRVELRMILIRLRAHAFDDVTPDEISLALTHPLVRVREAALMSLGR